jgi:methyl-accepting chemotaxis protein
VQLAARAAIEENGAVAPATGRLDPTSEAGENMTEHRRASSSPAAAAARALPARIVRRRYLIDPGRQLKTAALTTGLTVVLLGFVNLGFFLLRSSQTSILTAAAPQLSPVLDRQDTTMFLVMLGLSLILVVAVFVVTIVETHRTAGAVYAVGRRLERVRDGDYRVTLKLRRKDNLQRLEPPFNGMVAGLRRRALDDATALEELASRAEGPGAAPADLAAELRTMSAAKRELAGRP